MTTEEKIKVMQAYVDGKQIQTRAALFKGNWVDVNIEPSWDWMINYYRIKSEPKYRPYKDTSEMIADYKERFCVNVSGYTMPLIWISYKHGGSETLISKFYLDSVESGMWAYKMDDLYLDYTYLDGSPVGKLVEE
ncbi:MAG: hypothetical protein Q4A15_02005 [Prevotellaceae bacterium]|nr:hypothetical protein [Prevotellaceae bacterium]